MKGSVSVRRKLLIIAIIAVLCLSAALTYAMYRKGKTGSGSLDAATWSITRTQPGGDIDLVADDTTTDTYTLTVTSASEVDVIYKIIIDNVPTGVSVKLDDGAYQTPPANSNTITINAGTINYNDSVKTKTHTLTFKASANAQLVTDEDVDIDVEFRQGLGN